MLPVVQNRIDSFNRAFESYIHHLYRDVKGFVTVGVGNLIPSPTAAALLPFTHGPHGALAAAGEKAGAWNSVNAAPAGKLVTDAGDIYSVLTDLRLGDLAIDALVLATGIKFDNANVAEFPNYPDFSADAQLGLISMRWPGSWNMFKNFRAHVRNGEWCGAARECYFDDAGTNAGVKPRNLANRWLFSLAARVAGMELPPTTLYLDNPGANKLFLFKGGEYLRYDWDSNEVDKDYPASTAEAWRLPAPFSEGVDAAVDGFGGDKVPAFYGKTYFFRGGGYVRYDWDSNAVDVGPASLAAWGLKGEYAKGIDAAVNGQGKLFGKTFFFKGKTFVRYDWATDRIDQDETSIAEVLRLPEPFASGIDAAFNGEGPFKNRVYFFKGDKYIRCAWKPTFKVLSIPTDITPAWGGLAAQDFGSGIGAAVNAPGCLPEMQQPN